MNENIKKTVFQSKSKHYVEKNRIGRGSYSIVFLVEEEKSLEK